MANFRSGFLQRGYPLGNLTLTKRLDSDGLQVDPTGYGCIKLMGDAAVTGVSCTAVTTTITVTSTAHGLTSGDVIIAYNAASWTTSENANAPDGAAVTVLTDDTFTYSVASAPGASGTISYKLAPEMRTFTLLDGRVDGTMLQLFLGNDSQAQLVNTGNVALSSDWEPEDIYGTLQLMWQDSIWIETDRTMPASDIDVFIHSPSAGQVLVYDNTDSRFENVSVSGDIGLTSAGVASISAGVIVNADVNASAGIEASKLAAQTANRALASDGSGFMTASATTDTELGYVSGVTSAIQTQLDSKLAAALTDTQIFVGDGTNTAQGVAMSGDTTITNAGVVSISAGVIVDADVNATAGIAVSKLEAQTANRALASDGTGFITPSATTDTELGYVSGVTSAIQTQLDSKLGEALTDTQIFVGDGTNTASGVAMSGDATIANTGAVTIAPEAVTVAKLSGSVMKETTGALTQAAILALNTTPINIVGGAGAGIAYVIDEVQIFHDYDTAVYTGAGTLDIRYVSSSTIVSFASAVVTGGADAQYISFPSVMAADEAGSDEGLNIQAQGNVGLEFFNANTTFANGSANNIIKYRIRYHEVTLLT